MRLLQVIIWIVGVALAIYLAGYHLFFMGGVDLVMSVIDMFHSGVSKELAKTAVLGFVKMWFASLVAWIILTITAIASALGGK